MTNRRLVRAAAVFSGLALVLAACGDDDEPTSTDETTTTAGETSETTAGSASGEGNELVGMRGTTPLPETTPEVEAFQARMDAVDPALEDYNYGPESYDAVMLVALAAQVAGDDGSAHASEIINVSKEGEKCTVYADCLALIQAGTDIDFDGVSGPLDLDGVGDPITGSYGVLSFGEGNQLDDSLTEFVVRSSSDEVANQPVVPVEANRPGDGVLTIGTLLPETGSLAFLGPPEIAGVKVAIAEINEAGGFGGQPVVLVEGDSGDTSTDTATQTVTRELSQGVDAIIGAASSGVSLTVIDQVVGAGVTMFSPANTSKTLSTYDDNGLYFRTAPSDILQGLVLSEVIADDGHTSVVVLNLDDAYGNGLAEDFAANFEAAGGTVVDTIVYDPQAQTFDAEVGAAAGADADAILLIGFEESSRVLAAMVAAGIGPNDIPVYGCDGNMGNALGTDFNAGE
jgi:ABC-type branched-subunit amino acid transport system substrate-binding protein